jgi:hypothetical protein
VAGHEGSIGGHQHQALPAGDTTPPRETRRRNRRGLDVGSKPRGAARPPGIDLLLTGPGAVPPSGPLCTFSLARNKSTARKWPANDGEMCFEADYSEAAWGRAMRLLRSRVWREVGVTRSSSLKRLTLVPGIQMRQLIRSAASFPAGTGRKASPSPSGWPVLAAASSPVGAVSAGAASPCYEGLHICTCHRISRSLMLLVRVIAPSCRGPCKLTIPALK